MLTFSPPETRIAAASHIIFSAATGLCSDEHVFSWWQSIRRRRIALFAVRQALMCGYYFSVESLSFRPGGKKVAEADSMTCIMEVVAGNF
jgi:hypothetical protein